VSNLIKKDKGFTLIEIVLVLAIAGLLLVIVFLAVSGAQKSRRDSQRKSDAARILAQLEQSASNLSGAYPSTQALLDTFTSGYITTGNYKDPSSGTQYTLTYGIAAPAAGVMQVASNASCSGGLLVVGGGSRVAGVQTYVENGSSFCVDNK